MSSDEMLQAALRYAQEGNAVFPVYGIDEHGCCACGDTSCSSAGKHPHGILVPHGYHDATTDRATIERWWASGPHNIGLRANGTTFYPTDIDCKNGKDGFATWTKLTQGRDVPQTRQSVTPSGGLHIWWDAGGYEHLKYASNVLGEGVDVPNYIVVPPSRTPRGEYRWVSGHSVEDLEVAQLPEYLAAYDSATVNGNGNGYKHAAIPARQDDDLSEAVQRGLAYAEQAGSRDRGCYLMVGYCRDTRRQSEEQTSYDVVRYVEEANRLWPKDHAFSLENARKILERGYGEGRRDPAYDHKAHDRSAKRGGRGRWDDDEIAVGLNVVRASEVTEMPLRWLWQRYIPLSETTLFEGLPDLGKSVFTIAVTACVTQGKPMPDGTHSELEGPANVIILSCEDSPETTIVPRLRVAGADLGRVIIVKSASTKGGGPRQLEIPEDIVELRRAIVEYDAKLVIVDPLVGYIGGRVNTNNDAQVRKALTPLNEMAHDQGCAILALRHHNKDRSETDPLLRGGGSIGVTASARSLLVFTRDPEDPRLSPKRFLAVGKHNQDKDGAPTIVFEMQSVDTEVAGVPRSLPVLTYQGIDIRSARQLLEALATSEKIEQGGRGKLKEAFELLEELIPVGGEMLVEQIKTVAKERGITWGKMQRARDLWHAKGKLDFGSLGEGHDRKGTWRRIVEVEHVAAGVFGLRRGHQNSEQNSNSSVF